MAYLKRYLVHPLLLGIAPLLVVTATAQPVQRTDPTHFRLMALSPETPIPDLLYELQGTGIPVVTPTSEPSPAYRIPASTTLKLYTLVPAPSASPPGTKPSKEIKAEVSIAGVKPPLLILLSKAQTGSTLPYVGRAVTFSRETLPADTAQFFNFSERTIATKFDQDKFVLEPGATKIVHYTIQKRGDSITLKVAVAKKDGTWLSLLDNREPMNKNVRKLILYIESGESGATGSPVKIRNVTDWSAPPASKEKDPQV